MHRPRRGHRRRTGVQQGHLLRPRRSHCRDGSCIMTTTELPVPLLDRNPATALSVDHLCDISVDLEDPHVFQTPVGTRLTYVTKHGVLTGPRIRGELLGGGSGWVVLGTDGISRIDVRGTVRTDDGVLIHYESRGIAKFPLNGRDIVAAGGRVPFETSYICTTPRF